MPLTSRCETIDELKALNKNFGIFIVGSDQVFNWDFISKDFGVYFFSFVNDENKKIAYSASFGEKDFKAPSSKLDQVGLLLSRFSLAKKAGCTHFMSMDVDEYYVSDQLKTAKEKIIKNGIKASAACIIEYLKEPVYQMVNGYSFNMNKDFYTFYVPFIMKINKFFLQKHGSSSFPCLVDPTRGLNCSKKFYLFPAHELAMHHMSSIRKNLDKKYKNSNLMNSSDEVQKYVRNIQQQVLDFDFEKNKKFLETYSMFNQSLIRKVDNVFGIEFDDERINDFQKD